ncbi:hypothetical protein X971_4958 (plasmid) [Agrobacterium tumefaciens LBA4213 (Ach5)]|nr:hypothetical protein X971_4958 [Agrobacterium tumefaciens LBA4213 (Ach5)]
MAGKHMPRQGRPYASPRALEKLQVEGPFQPLQSIAQGCND